MTTDRHYLIVGGTSGIGRAIAERLRGTGAQVVTAARGRADAAPDIEWDAAAAPLPDAALPERLDGLVYAPGTINLKPFPRLTDDDFEADLAVNLMGAVRAIRGTLDALKAAPSASVVLFSTVAVGTGMPFHASVASAKGAVEGLTRALAAELAPSIRVNAIAPSLTDTPLAGRLLGDEQRRQRSADRHPLKRVGTVDDVAFLATALLGDELSWATGQVFGLDGGLSAVHPG